MRAIITGGTGFIGQALTKELKAHGWEIVVLSRNPGKVADVYGHGVIGMKWDNGDWPDLLGEQTVIVNLAGENIAGGRWTSAKKQRILKSRLDAGDRILRSINLAETMPAAVIQASAVGYYGPQGTKTFDESAPNGSGFLADVARQWEDSTKALDDMGVRRAIIRTGMVLGNGGALAKLLTPFKYYVGGPPGEGLQGVSWIHIRDEVRAIRFLMENEACSGPYNLTAPTPVRFRKFARILGETLNRPHKLNVPPVALRLLYGDMADEVLLSGQLVLPTRLQEAGFEFDYPELSGALKNLLA